MRLFLILFLINATAWAETPSGSPFALRQMGVRIEKPAGDGVHFSQGSGVFVGEGMVLTAAHVVRPDPARRQVIVLLGGWRLDAALVDGAQDDDLDLALIQIPPQAMSIAHQPAAFVPVCPDNPTAAKPVTVVAMGEQSQAVTVATNITSKGQTDGWTNLLDKAYSQGNSGGGVFDPQRGCLWGIINLKLSGPSGNGDQFLDLTAFVPATQIRKFLRDHGPAALP